jgi:dihydrofolate reductase
LNPSGLPPRFNPSAHVAAGTLVTRKVLAQFHVTLDGVAGSGPDPTPVPDEAMADFWESSWGGGWDTVDTLLLGRHTYDAWAGFWPAVEKMPDADKQMLKFASFANRAEKVVFSRTLESASWEKSRIVRGDVAKEVHELKSRTGGNLGLGGGRMMFQELVRLGLMDEFRLILYPRIAGRGMPLFDVEQVPDNSGGQAPNGPVPGHLFRLVEARPLKNSAVLFLHYAKAPAPDR